MGHGWDVLEIRGYMGCIVVSMGLMGNIWGGRSYVMGLCMSCVVNVGDVCVHVCVWSVVCMEGCWAAQDSSAATFVLLIIQCSLLAPLFLNTSPSCCPVW